MTLSFRGVYTFTIGLALLPGFTAAAQEPLMSRAEWTAIRDQASGSAPYENLRALTRLHRVPGTVEFDQAADYVLARAQEYGLSDVHEERFPIDGQIHYGLMRSHLSWTVEAGQLWKVQPEHTLLADWASNPIRLADYSHSADVETQLVDVGAGSSEADYATKDVRGKIVLADGVLSTVQHLAVMTYGAAGIVSDMPNQTTAWTEMDHSLIRWGHMDASSPRGFAFMVSAATASALRIELAAAPVVLSAHVRATVAAGHWTVVTATIPGTDARAGEVVFSCHLDHQRPGANDNASGCVTILETARILQMLIAGGQLPRPERTVRFLWGPEVEGTMAFLSRHPELLKTLHADVHMDMVGGDPFKNKSMLHVTETPWSLPSFVTDVGALYAETLRNGAAVFAQDGSHPEAAVLEDRDGASGTRNELLFDETPYAEGSDHDDYDSSTIAIPSLYLRDWPDVYIHTDHDTLVQIDATKLRRVAVLGAASGYTYANLVGTKIAALLPFFAMRSEERLARGSERAVAMADDTELAPAMAAYEARNLETQLLLRERGTLLSFAANASNGSVDLSKALAVLEAQSAQANRWIEEKAVSRGFIGHAAAPWVSDARASRVPQRIGEFGPLTYQNDDVLFDRLGAKRMRSIQLLNGSSRLVRVQDRGALYAYEIVNFVDGHRTVGEIRDAVSGEFGPITLDVVYEYLKACEDAGVIRMSS